MDRSAGARPVLMLAPGAKAAKVCGILAILFALTFVGAPVALVLAIVALVQHRKARRLAESDPARYAAGTAAGQILGIVGLVLSGLALCLVGMVGAIAFPEAQAYRERVHGLAVRTNLETARRQAEATVQAIHARTPGQIPSQDMIIQALSTDPLIQSLKNPITPAAPAFQRGTHGPLGTVMVYGDREEAGGVTTWSIQFRATIRQRGQEQVLQGEVITHTEERVQRRTEDGWDVVQPTAEQPPAPAPPPQP